MSEALQRRAQQVRARWAVRAWEYRQRDAASGVWFRLRRVLADAEQAYSVSEEDARQLIGEGFAPEAVGFELEPPKVLLFAPPERIAALREPMPLQLALDPTMLAARQIVLVRFAARP